MITLIYNVNTYTCKLKYEYTLAIYYNVIKTIYKSNKNTFCKITATTVTLPFYHLIIMDYK